MMNAAMHQMNSVKGIGNCPITDRVVPTLSSTITAVSEATDDIRVSRKTTTQAIAPSATSSGYIASSTPELVATALPPLKLRKIGKVCPRIAAAPTNITAPGGSIAHRAAASVDSIPLSISSVTATRNGTKPQDIHTL